MPRHDQHARAGEERREETIRQPRNANTNPQKHNPRTDTPRRCRVTHAKHENRSAQGTPRSLTNPQNPRTHTHNLGAEPQQRERADLEPLVVTRRA